MAARDSGFRRVYVRSLPVVLAAVALANLIISPSLRDDHLPIRTHDAGTLTHLVSVEQRTTDRRYSFYMELGEVAAGQILRVPEGSPVEAWMIDGLADVELEIAEYDPSVLPLEAVPGSEPLGELGTPEGLIPYWILPGDGPRWLGYHQGGIVIVPDSVAPMPGGGS